MEKINEVSSMKIFESFRESLLNEANDSDKINYDKKSYSLEDLNKNQLRELKDLSKRIGKGLYQYGNKDNGWEINNSHIVAHGYSVDYMNKILEKNK